MTEKPNICCSFCGIERSKVKKLIQGPDVFICDECVDLCQEILAEDGTEKKATLKSKEIPSPVKIKEFLDKYIIGQDEAKISMAVAVNNHYKRVENPVIDGVEIDKSNMLLLGPTGSGKTYIAKTIARMLDVPFIVADATSLTESGYVGDDVESIIARLIQEAGNDVSKAERGIIYLDEIDKKTKKSEGTSITRDVSGEGVQQALLKIIEGSSMRVSLQGSRKHPQAETIAINTKNILFILGGAFVGIDEIIRKRINSNKISIGFDIDSSFVEKNELDKNELLALVEPEDIVSFGLIPEFVGRIPVITHLNELNEQQLLEILTKPKNAIIRQYEKMFSLEEVKLDITKEALTFIAADAIKRKTGARGLRGILEKKLTPIQFRLNDWRHEGVILITLGADFFADGAEPVLKYKQETILGDTSQ